MLEQKIKFLKSQGFIVSISERDILDNTISVTLMSFVESKAISITKKIHLYDIFSINYEEVIVNALDEMLEEINKKIKEIEEEKFTAFCKQCDEII